MKHDSRIDDYIADKEEFAQPILERLRALMAEVVPDAEEDIKWGAPHWVVGGRNLAGVSAFKAHVRIFPHGAIEEDEKADWDRFGRLTSVADCPDVAELKRLLASRIKLLESGKPLARAAAKEPIPVPDDFTDALQASPAAVETWAAFTDAQRREYLDWIVSAKREETRAKRIATAAEWISEGRRRNWKYENC